MNISILAPSELHPLLDDIIAAEDRLHELVALVPATSEYRLSADVIRVDGHGLCLHPDWYNLQPPVLLPARIPLSRESLLGILFLRLNHPEKTRKYLQAEPDLLLCAELLFALQQGDDMPADMVWRLADCGDRSAAAHNLAVCMHYSGLQGLEGLSDLKALYEEALAVSPEPDARAFTARHYATLLTDAGLAEEAEALIRRTLVDDLHEDSRHGLTMVECQSWLSRLTVPYDQALLSRLKAQLWDDLQYLERTGRTTEVGLLLLDAAHIANISNSFSESLGYLNRATAIFQAEGQDAFTAHAHLKKGILLYTWAQNGNPQFYRAAKDALLEALGFFTRDAAPHVFADIHHHLGVIYSEIPDEVKKKSVWAAVSVSSFQEALSYYNKVDFPYEFGMVCHHFGNAYTKYPAAVHSDNYDKALAWYREALDVRSAANHPIERSHTLSNYLEASWKAANPDDSLNERRFEDMWEKATELRAITTGEELRREAEEHLRALESLRMHYAVR